MTRGQPLTGNIWDSADHCIKKYVLFFPFSDILISMLKGIHTKNTFETPPLAPPSAVYRPLPAPSCLESANPAPNHCVNYFKNLLIAFSEVLWRLYELLKVILCCETEEKKSTSYTPIEQASNGTEEDLFYATLELSEKNQKNIFDIFHTMASSSVELAIKSFQLLKKGSDIQHVHPFKVLECFFRTDLKFDILEIKKKESLWNRMIQNFEEGFTRIPLENLLKYLPGFAHAIGVDPDLLFPYVQQRKWENLIRFLLDTLN